MANSPKDFLPIIAGIISEPEPTAEARQPTDISKSDRGIKEEKSEGVKFYELDEKEEFLPTGNDPIPQVTMPSFKKRVHSQRIGQRERPAVTPYEGPYDEKYSSDEENVDYEVCEPEDLTERSNSTVTFSEDIYDSDTVDELIRNQLRKASEISQESLDLMDGSGKPKSILKEGKARGSKKDSRPTDLLLQPSQKITQIIVSPPEKIPEGAIAEGSAIKPEAATPGINKKDEKGEKLIEDVTKPLQGIITDTVTDKESSVKGENRETVTKSPQSTIPKQIDQITDSSATNKHDFTKNDERLLMSQTEPLEDTASRFLTEAVLNEKLDQERKSVDAKTEIAKSVITPESQQKPFEFFSMENKEPEKTEENISHLIEMDSLPKTDAQSISDHKTDPGALVGKAEKIMDTRQESLVSASEKTSVLPEESPKKQFSPPSREEAAETAEKLLDDITKTVQDVFLEIPTAMKPEDVIQETGEIFESKSVSGDWKIQNGGTKQLQGLEIVSVDAAQFSKPTVPSSLSEVKTDKTKEAEGKVSLEERDEAVKTTDSVKPQQIEETVNISKEIPVPKKETPREPLTNLETKEKTEKLIHAKPEEKKDSPDKVANGVAKTFALGRDITADISEKLVQSVKDAVEDATPFKAQNTGQEYTSAKAEREDVLSAPKTADILMVEGFDKFVEPVEKTGGEFKSGDSPSDAQDADKSRDADKPVSGEKPGATDVVPELPSHDPSETKPRVIFRIDSEDDLHSEVDNDLMPPSNLSSPAEEFLDKSKEELKQILERDQMKIEERLTSMKGRIFDISDESLSKTKELVDERLRKISEIKPLQELEEAAARKEKSPGRGEYIKIGRFHISPALVEEVVSRTKEREIAERLKTTRTDDEKRDEVEKELPEKLTEADLEEVIRELKKEGLKTDVYLQPEDTEREEKKEKTLKRVERRFERMASETLEKEKEEGVSEEKLNEKREIEFQRMISDLSSEEVAECQQEYLQLWDEGGLSSLTPTDDWESRDPDTPENELDDDTPRKSESFRGSHGIGETGEPTKSSEPKKSLKSPTSPPKPVRISSDISLKGQPLTPVDHSHVGSSPSEIDPSSGFVSERSDDIPTYGDRKKFWEQMSSSQSSETASELPRSMVESTSSVESVEIDRVPKKIEESEKISVKAAKQKFEATEGGKISEETGVVKSLTESYSKKIAAGELIMPAIPRPKSSVSKESLASETEQTEILKTPDSSDTAVVSELEVKLNSRGAPITEHTVVTGSTTPEKQIDEFPREPTAKPKKMGRDTSSDKSTDSEAEFISKYGVESVAFDNGVFSDETASLPLSERRKLFEDPSQIRPPPMRKSVHERSMSLPTADLPIGVKTKKKYFEDEMKKEMIVEQIMAQREEEIPEETPEEKIKMKTPEVEEAASNAMTEVLLKGVKIVEETLRYQQKAGEVPESQTETHEEKSEVEDNEKEKTAQPKKTKEEELIPSIMVTTTGKRQPETGSIGESEDTQSESDVTPEECRVVDNGDAQWDGMQSGGFSPKDDIDYPKEVRETGIGRWIGQEDLSKPSWDKDDLDSSHFKMQTKWERTRSEGASPKEHYVCTPEEHYPDTVWEVPVQEQLEKEEITHDIPIEKQVIIEKDEEEYEDDDEAKTKLTEEEAKEIAEEILEYIQFEVENRSSFLVNDEETPEGITQAQVTDYLRHLTGGKEFDENDVQLIESILAKKQKGHLWKSQSADTAACSVDITDEELRSTGLDNDISPIESQITKLQNLDEEDSLKGSPEFSEKLETEKDSLRIAAEKDAKRLNDVEIVDQTIAEVKESLEAAQEQLIEQHKRNMKSEVLKKESPSEFEFKGMSYDRKITEAITEQATDWEKAEEYETTTAMTKTETSYDMEQKHKETVKKVTGDEKLERTAEESLRQQTTMKTSVEEELIRTELEKEKMEKKLSKESSDEEKKLVETQQTETKREKPGEVTSDRKSMEKTDFDKATKKTEELIEKVESEGKRKEQFDLQKEDREVQQIKEKEIIEKDAVYQKDGETIQTSSVEEKEKFRDSLRESEKIESKTIEKDTTGVSSKSSSSKTEILISDSKIEKSVIFETKTDKEEIKNIEIGVPERVGVRKIGEQVYSSEESPRSVSLEDSTKSPGEEIQSSTSSGERQDEKVEKSDVVLRHSITSTHLKTDRRSGADLEPYSSSGESHYHSFEQTSSRPCSSDVEGLLTGNIGTTGSSEYESAISHEMSSKQPTLTDYQTAVSSLSSRESIRSLDSESSGHLASVEVSSEASETLIPSALELDRDIVAPGTLLLDDDGFDLDRSKSVGQTPVYRTQMSAPAAVSRLPDEDFEIISESEVASWTGGVSEDEEGVPATGEDAILSEENAQKMKRSHEMTFQPEPKPIAFSESLDVFSKDGVVERPSLDENSSIISAPDERLGSSLEESGSVLSMSLSTTSEPSAMRTVIELSHTDSEKMDGSLTVSATSIDSREDFDVSHPQSLTSEMSTSTPTSGLKRKPESVTISTSSSDVHGVSCVSTQVTSVSRKSSMVEEGKSESESHDNKSMDLSHANGPTQVEYVADYDEVETTKTKKPQGHRRKESTSNFVPTMMWNMSEARTQKVKADIVETDEEYGSNKYVYDITLTEKEVKNDEKKEADDLESYEQGFEVHERKISEGEEVDEFKDYDNNRPQSQISRTDSDSGRRPVSSVFSEDQPDSELSELMKQGSSETEREDPLERPLSPEPEDMENKDITPEFSSEAQASVTELEMEYSGAFSRRDEYASHVSPIREEKSDSRFKETSEEYPEAETIPDGLRSQTSLESTIAEKHELETGEKEILQKKSESVNDIPDITVTEHVTPVSQQKFSYPEPKEEGKDKKSTARTPDTPASSRTSSSSTDQGKEYNLEDDTIKKIPREVLTEEKEVSETKDEKESLDSPSSDSFEMLDKPDITDEFVIIEEVGREAQENDQEGKSIQISSGKKKPPKRVKEDQDVKMSPPTPTTKMTDLKYFPSEEDTDLFSFDSDSPPQQTTRKFAEKLKRRSSKEEKDDAEYEQQIEQNKKWLETQFQGEPAAKIIGAFGYEMEFERAPLEDIKEEDLNELDSSSKIGSMGSQKESLGSFGSVKDSFSSTPDYDVLAGRKYFTRSGDHDDVSMSSLQEFELIEKKLMENGKKSGSSSSQDSLSSKKLGTSSKSGQGEDVSSGSLKEFEILENACATVVNMEKKAKQEEAILSEIDEGHESQISESESCETVSAVIREKMDPLDSEDFDRKMFEIDEIIRQAQSNVEKFSEMQALEKIETIGRGDSYEEVAKVPDLELDLPLPGKSGHESSKFGRSYIPIHTTQPKKKAEEWRTGDKPDRKEVEGMTSVKAKQESELLQNGGKMKSISADSLEIQAEKQIILEGKEETISLDSYRSKPQKSSDYGFPEMAHKSDSMEEVSKHLESSSSGTEHTYRAPPRTDFILGSTDSLDPSSSTATHATYQYETDSVMSSSFTSGDSNTMVSSTDNLDLLVSGQPLRDLSSDLGISRMDNWLENLEVGGANPLDKHGKKFPTSRLEMGDQRREFSKSFQHEKVDFERYKHDREITELGPQVQKIVFKGPNAEKDFEEYAMSLKPEDDVMEVEEIDEHGNIHVKKVLRQRIIVRPSQELSKDELQQYLSSLAESESLESYSHVVQKKIDVPTDIQKVTFKGPDAEKQFQAFMQQQQNPEVEEIEEVDEHGNIHIKRVIRQRVVVRPSRELSKDELEEYLNQLEEPETPEAETTELGGVSGSPNIQKITFKGPDAEKQYQEFMQEHQEPKIEEIEEVDEHGNVHIKKILRQRVVIRPDKKLSKDELEQYLTQLQQSEAAGASEVTLPAGIEKITFKGPDAEKQYQEFMQGQQEPEIEEIEEVDEHGNVHIKKILRQRVVIRPDSKLSKDELEQYLTQLQQSEAAGASEVTLPAGIEKITFKGPDAEKQYQEFMQGQQEPEIEEIEEVDEHGNVHIKKILRQRVVIRPDSKLSKDELEQYLTQLQHSEAVESAPEVTLPAGIQKITFKGPDAEKQYQEFLQEQQEPEIEEIEEVDEHGNVHIKKILRQRVVVRPESKLTKDQLEKYLSQQPEPKTGESAPHLVTTGIQKITFKGPDAEKQFQEFLHQQQPEITEIEEVDEHGNVHIKKILQQRIVVREDRKLTKDELEQHLHQPQESDETQIQMPAEIQKVTFKGPDAEKQFQEFLQQEPDVEQIEEVDEHGNVHIKKYLRQRVVVRPDGKLTKHQLEEYLRQLQELESAKSTSDAALVTGIQKIAFKGPDAEKQFQEFIKQQQESEFEEIEETDEYGNVHVKRIIKQQVVLPEQTRAESAGKLLTKDELQEYLDNLEKREQRSPEGESTGVRLERDSSGPRLEEKVLVQKVVLEPQELANRLLTEEEFQERLKQRQAGETTVHTEDIYIGSGEPFVSEIIEPLDEEGFSHIIHKKMQMAPEVQKVVFRGPNAEEAMKAYVEALNPGEDFEEVEEVDSEGNVHVKRILRRKIVLKPEDLEKTGLTGEELKSYLQQFEFEYFEGGPRMQPSDPNIPTNQVLKEGFSSSVVLTDKESRTLLEESKPESESSSAVRKECGISQRPPLVSDVSMDDEAEFDPTEHDWRHQLEILHAEADEDEIDQNLDAALMGSSAPEKKK